jgi:hypothetical protein
MSEFDKILSDILGKNAFFSTDFKVEDDVRRLAFAVRYLNTQIKQCQKFMPDDEKDYVDSVQKSVVEILKGNLR